MTTEMDDSTVAEKAKELFVLRISTILTVSYAVVGIFIAIISDSLSCSWMLCTASLMSSSRCWRYL